MKRAKDTARLRRTVAIALTMLLGCAPILSLAETVADVLYVNNPEPLNRLNLREQASLESPVLGRYYTGTTVEVLGTQGDFTNVRINDLVGYMQTTYLSETRMPLSLGAWASVSLEGADEKLHLRTQTEEGALSLGLFYTGTPVQILADAEEHYQVRLVDLEGFMMKKYLQVDGDPGKQDITLLTNGRLTVASPLYCFPSTDALSLGMRFAGETVEILGVTGTWYYVQTGREEDPAYTRQCGFLPGHLLEVSNYNGSAPFTEYTYAVVRSSDEKVKQHLRQDSAWSSTSLGTFLNNAQVLVLDTIPEEGQMPLWVHVSIGGLDGYMLGEALNRVYKDALEWTSMVEPGTRDVPAEGVEIEEGGTETESTGPAPALNFGITEDSATKAPEATAPAGMMLAPDQEQTGEGEDNWG